MFAYLGLEASIVNCTCEQRQVLNLEFRIQSLDADGEMEERTEEGGLFGGRARRKKKALMR